MRRLMTFGIVAQACVLACGCADKKNPTDKKEAWDGAKALRCAGEEEVRLEGKEIRTTHMWPATISCQHPVASAK